jgi:hypothetical protein
MALRDLTTQEGFQLLRATSFELRHGKSHHEDGRTPTEVLMGQRPSRTRGYPVSLTSRVLPGQGCEPGGLLRSSLAPEGLSVAEGVPAPELLVYCVATVPSFLSLVLAGACVLVSPVPYGAFTPLLT